MKSSHRGNEIKIYTKEKDERGKLTVGRRKTKKFSEGATENFGVWRRRKRDIKKNVRGTTLMVYRR